MDSPESSFQKVRQGDPFAKMSYRTVLQVLGINHGRFGTSRYKKPRRGPWN